MAQSASGHGTCLGIGDLARMEGTVQFVVSADRTSASATFVWNVLPESSG